jgi:hypothetical protein
MSERKVMIVWPGGQKYPFAGDMPEVGAVIAGFIVRSIRDHAVDLSAPSTPEEEEAVEEWERERRAR